MEMLNETAIRIIGEIPVKTDEQKAALDLATSRGAGKIARDSNTIMLAQS